MMGRYKLRTYFMMLGSLIGVAALTFVLSIGKLAPQKILEWLAACSATQPLLFTPAEE